MTSRERNSLDASGKTESGARSKRANKIDTEGPAKCY